MFIDNKRMVSLEYIFYQKSIDDKGKSNYQTAREHVEGNLNDDEHMLGAEEYVKNIEEATKQTNAFTNKPIVYDTKPERQNCFLDEMGDNHMIHSNKDGSEDYQVECMITLWNISKAGTLMKYKE